MTYKMEELLPVVGKLAEKYTSFESTSVTYEKAEQLMGAVLYCIRETGLPGRHELAADGGRTAQRAYEDGLACVGEKVKVALDLYNNILPEFDSYENCCLYDTFVKALPEFFQWYDMKFEPQNTIVMLDYPVLKDLSGSTGIDKVYEFIECIHLEQSFLKIFPKSYVTRVLAGYDKYYKEMIDNICGIVFLSILGHMLIKKPLSEPGFIKEDYLRMEAVLTEFGPGETEQWMRKAVEVFIGETCGGDEKLLEYLSGSIPDYAIRAKEAAGNGVLERIIL